MQLIQPLVSGINGAGNGTALVFSRGTSTPATLYSDYVGTTLANSVSGITLDANGGALLYVNEEVDVTVKDSAGNPVRSFTVMTSAPVVEVRSQSFTGKDYVTLGATTGYPTTLQTVLDGWKTSAGASDFNVLVGGVSSTIQNALGSIAGIFYNVKSPQFGAVGDGVADDTTAIQNAINAANTAGGGIVFFPYGAYKTSSVLDVKIGVSLWGAGNSAIYASHATANVLQYGTGTTLGVYDEIRGLVFDHSAVGTGATVYIQDSGLRYISIVNCVFGSGANTNSTGEAVLTASTSRAHRVLIDNCIMRTWSTTKNVIDSSTSGAYGCSWSIRSCYFSCHSANWTNVVGLVGVNNAKVVGCVFDMSVANNAGSGGVCLTIYGDNGAAYPARATITGNEFIPRTAGTYSYAISLLSADRSTTAITEGNSIFRAGFDYPFRGAGVSANLPSYTAQSRENLQTTQTGTGGAAIDLKGDKFGISVVERTGDVAAAMTSSVGPLGSRLTVIILAKAVALTAPNTLTWGTGFMTATMPTVGAVTINTSAIYEFRSVYENGTAYWVPVSTGIKNI